MENQVNFEVSEHGGKNGYLKYLFFPTFPVMKERYPILENLPVLLPATWIDRIFKEVFSKVIHLKERFYKIKLIKEADPEEVAKLQEIHKKLGIK